MKTAELKNKTVNELNSELHALLKEQFNLRMQRGGGQLSQTHLFRKIRRSIARIRTIISARENL